MRRTFVLLPVLGALAMAACGDDDSGGSVPLDQMESTYLHTVCETMIRCGSESFLAAFDGDADACYDYLSTLHGGDFSFQYLVDAVNAGNASYDAHLAAQCVDSLRGASCEEVLGNGPEPEACQDAIVGLEAEGASCTMDEECASGWCDMRAACPGTCGAPALEGDSCVDGTACDRGLVCIDGLCAQDPGPAANGEPCDQSECAYGLYCDYGAASSTCTPRGGAGAACDGEEQCDYGMVCDSTGQCKATTVAGSGEPCNPEDGVFCSFPDGQACAMDVMNERYLTCEDYRQLDESCLEVDQQAQTSAFYACDPLAGLYCDVDFQNNTGVCQAKKVDGSACQRDAECSSGHCDSSNNQCASGDPGPCGDGTVQPE